MSAFALSNFSGVQSRASFNSPVMNLHNSELVPAGKRGTLGVGCVVPGCVACEAR